MLTGNRTHPFAARVAVLLVVVLIAAQAETITLRDGSKIKGTVVKQSEKELEVKTPYGTLAIDKSSVLSIDFDGASNTEQQPAIEQPREPDRGAQTYYEYTRGRNDGRQRGHTDGYSNALAARKGERMEGAWIGCILSLFIGVVVYFAAFTPAHL